MRPLRRSWHSIYCALASALFVCILISVTAASAQPTANSPRPQENSMQHYALLFRTTRALTPEEQKQRPGDIAAWIKQVSEMGITLSPHTLEETVLAIPANGSDQSSASDPILTNIVLFDAATRDQAIKVTRLHPAPRYGVSVELREWTAPRPLVTQP